MPCKMCQERGKDWSGSDPNCYFDEPIGSNWNCATINAIRDIFSPDGWWVESDDLQDGVCATLGDDMTYGLIKTDDIFTEDDEWMGRCLYVQWYKRRGRTEALWIVGEDEGEFNPRRPTEAELLAIIKHYKKIKLLEGE